MDLQGAGLPLSTGGLVNACQQLGVKAPELWALIFTETDPPYGGFWSDRRPQILYEQHVFHRLTGGRFDQTDPQISSSQAGNYGASGAHQYDRLTAAMKLDESAALQSVSWGIGQTLGENYKIVGFSSPQEMVKQMLHSEDDQLLAAVREILATHCDANLAAHDWAGFARIYNGPAFAKNKYDEHLRGWHAKFSAGPLPDMRVRAAQVYLMYLDCHPGVIDGVWGARTRAAMNAYQTRAAITTTEDLDDATFERLVREAQG